ncbi:MAG: hypothetical protein A2138_22695 [Deltaproteobacteria bacterium RBG_16_71_12]|nr:MAG: hypothetical protein A2138_22695 [Deltaproteobacteria bacterium RBG_16_71_12]
MDAAAAPVVTRPSVRQLLGLAWPIVITRSAQVVVGFTDAAMVARLGESELAATTAGATNAFNILILPMGVAFIISTYASQKVGAGDAPGARRYGFYGLVLALAAGVLCLAALPAVPSLLSLFDYTPEVTALMTGYLWYRLPSGGFAIGLEALGNYFNGLGNTRLPMAAQVIAMAANVALNWVLIYGHLGAPALGVQGAALASSLATLLGFAFLLGCFLAGVGQRTRAVPRLSLAELGQMLKIGLPSGLNWFVEFAAFSFFINVVVAGLGTSALAAVMAVFQLNSISFMPAFALASAGAIFVGQAIGAKRHDDVPRTVRLTFSVAATWQGVVGACYLVAPALLFSVFVKDGAGQGAFLAVGVRILMLSAAWQLVDAGSMVLAEALRAAGDTAYTFWVRAGIAWGIFAPGAYWSVNRMGGGDVIAVAWLVVYLALLAAALLWRFRTGRWRTIDIGVAP